MVVAFSVAITDPVELMTVARETPGTRNKMPQLDSFMAGTVRHSKAPDGEQQEQLVSIEAMEHELNPRGASLYTVDLMSP